MKPSDDLNPYLRVGAPASLDLRPESKNAPRFTTALRGWELGRYLMFDIPEVEGRQLTIGRRQPCVIRLVGGGAVCAFRSIVIQCFDTGPQPHFMLNWPDEFSTKGIRQYERLDVALPCRIASDGAETIAGRVRDLSAGGCQIESSRHLAVGETVLVTFALPDGVMLEDVQCTIRNVRSQFQGAMAGCQFTDERESIGQDIEFYISSSMARFREDEEGARVLLLTNAPDHESFNEALAARDIDLIPARDVVELCHRFRLARPIAVLLDWRGDDLPIARADVCGLIATSKTAGRAKIFVAGIDGDEAEACRKRGADHVLGPNESLTELLPHLPGAQG